MNFNRNWTDYENGFGDLNGDFWYGLKKIHCLSAREKLELRIELGYGDEPEIVWTYQTFTVGDSSTNYRLTIGGQQGNGDTVNSMSGHNGQPFSTRDRSNIPISAGSRRYNIQCGSVVGAGWWFYQSLTYVSSASSACHTANLNGAYDHTDSNYELGWKTASGYVHYTHVQMKIRPHTCSPRASQLCA